MNFNKTNKDEIIKMLITGTQGDSKPISSVKMIFVNLSNKLHHLFRFFDK
jgi:hypothetical protein